MFQFLLAASSKWHCSPIVKLSHSKKDQLDFWGHTISPIQGNWGPLGTLRRVLGGARKWHKYASDNKKFNSPPFTPATPSLVKSSHSKILYLDLLWHTRFTVGNPWGPAGPLEGPLRARKLPKHASNCHIFHFPPTPSFPHSETIP